MTYEMACLIKASVDLLFWAGSHGAVLCADHDESLCLV